MPVPLQRMNPKFPPTAGTSLAQPPYPICPGHMTDVTQHHLLATHSTRCISYAQRDFAKFVERCNAKISLFAAKKKKNEICVYIFVYIFFHKLLEDFSHAWISEHFASK